MSHTPTMLKIDERIADDDASSGRYARREDRGRWHIVESWIAGDAIAYCGRRLPNEANDYGRLIVTDGAREALCRVCAKRST